MRVLLGLSLKMHLVVGEPIVHVLNNNLFESEGLEVTGDQKYTVENIWSFPPDFRDDTYQLNDTSPLRKLATDGLDLGLIIN